MYVCLWVCRTMALAPLSLQGSTSGNHCRSPTIIHTNTHTHPLVCPSVIISMGSRKLRLGRWLRRMAESAGGEGGREGRGFQKWAQCRETEREERERLEEGHWWTNISHERCADDHSRPDRQCFTFWPHKFFFTTATCFYMSLYLCVCACWYAYRVQSAHKWDFMLPFARVLVCTHACMCECT